jgi:hypothetical protein
MIVSTPYVECYVKRSFLSGTPIYEKDETIFGILIGIRYIRGRAPLYIVYLPTIGSVYDKVDQCAIFKRETTPDTSISMEDVGWWDSISDYWQLIQIKFLKGFTIHSTSKNGTNMSGKYLFTCDPQGKSEIDWGQSECWHEHKTKTYFFDELTGVLVSTPNNKMRVFDSSLSTDPPESPNWLRVYNDINHPERTSHETNLRLGNNNSFTYKK